MTTVKMGATPMAEKRGDGYQKNITTPIMGSTKASDEDRCINASLVRLLVKFNGIKLVYQIH